MSAIGEPENKFDDAGIAITPCCSSETGITILSSVTLGVYVSSRRKEGTRDEKKVYHYRVLPKKVGEADLTKTGTTVNDIWSFSFALFIALPAPVRSPFNKSEPVSGFVLLAAV